MKRILAIVALSLSLTGCVYGGDSGPSYGYYGGTYSSSGYPGPPLSEQAATPR